MTSSSKRIYEQVPQRKRGAIKEEVLKEVKMLERLEAHILLCAESIFKKIEKRTKVLNDQSADVAQIELSYFLFFYLKNFIYLFAISKKYQFWFWPLRII